MCYIFQCDVSVKQISVKNYISFVSNIYSMYVQYILKYVGIQYISKFVGNPIASFYELCASHIVNVNNYF